MNIMKFLKRIALTDICCEDEVYTNALLLEKMVLKYQFVDENRIVKLANDLGLITKLQNLYECFESSLEKAFAQKMINNNNISCSDYLLYNRFKTLITNEINLAKIKEDEEVLFIGSGPFPITAILLNYLTSCKVYCIDKDPTAVEISKSVILKLSLLKDIKISRHQGEKVKIDKYSLILIALLAKPKYCILSNIKSQTKKDIRVICRTSFGVRQLLYKPIDKKAYSDVEFSKLSKASFDQTISSIYLKLTKEVINEKY